MDACLDAFASQALDGLGGGAEEVGGDVVGEDAVGLLRQVAVVAAEAGLDVGDGDAELRRGERAGQRRVGVAVDEDEVRATARR